jgi:hypothetical protein
VLAVYQIFASISQRLYANPKMAVVSPVGENSKQRDIGSHRFLMLNQLPMPATKRLAILSTQSPWLRKE